MCSTLHDIWIVPIINEVTVSLLIESISSGIEISKTSYSTVI